MSSQSKEVRVSAEPGDQPAAAPVVTQVPAPTDRAAAREVRTVAPTVAIQDLHAYYGDQHAVRGVSMTYAANEVTAMIGPSGCGKSTLVRCINRMHEEIVGARAQGTVTLDEADLYDDDVDPVSVRRTIGMVFQKPNPFPTMSIFDNVAAGLRLTGRRGDVKDRVETSLRGAGLWDEVKDRLARPGMGLSGGQQQRLCIARTIAVEPDVIIMDEPCSALDPVATLRIEELIEELKRDYTIIIVTHNMQQAARVADKTAFMLTGELVEFTDTRTIFTNPSDTRTEEYVTGKFG
ncbi:MAG: phosphate transport system ATP-binding protein [Solirubrobacteraceae bacterium]|jgi:phosphate transport system ATP-binding protein|nr:phosphate transport system ATP-binding protein [Solirubrobacteraceae bacterium]